MYIDPTGKFRESNFNIPRLYGIFQDLIENLIKNTHFFYQIVYFTTSSSTY